MTVYARDCSHLTHAPAADRTRGRRRLSPVAGRVRGTRRRRHVLAGPADVGPSPRLMSAVWKGVEIGRACPLTAFVQTRDVEPSEEGTTAAVLCAEEESLIGR